MSIWKSDDDSACTQGHKIEHHTYIELDVLVLWPHQEIAGLAERRNLLEGLLESANILDVAVPILILDQTLAVGGATEGGVMKHDDDVVRGDVDI